MEDGCSCTAMHRVASNTRGNRLCNHLIVVSLRYEV